MDQVHVSMLLSYSEYSAAIVVENYQSCMFLTSGSTVAP